ncbi:MAG: DUF3396 domain-containing protein [Pseudomonadales bacterium]|jgi:hypothetical protein|nr:DUF3396 domain-containing protein [Pseudomonadales bacterium]
MDFFEEWDAAKWHFTYGDEDQPENKVLQGGLVIVLYMVKSYLSVHREALAGVMEQLQGLMRQQLRWGWWEHPRQKITYTPKHFLRFIQWIRQRPLTHTVSFTWSSGPGYDFVGSYGARAFSQMNLKEEAWRDISYLEIYLPVEVLQAEGRLGFEVFVQELASRLPVLHGHAGLGFQQCNEYHRHEHLEFELAQQFLGFDVGNPLGHNELRDGFKSVNWYTILDASWLDKLGGHETLAKAVHEEAKHELSLLDYDGGVIVKAGQWPCLGWVERDPQPAAYVAANRILKSVRAPTLRGLHMGSFFRQARFDDASTDHWLRRFDAPDH